MSEYDLKLKIKENLRDEFGPFYNYLCRRKISKSYQNIVGLQTD